MRLENRVAIVTGGARGIGEGISRCLAEEGARIAVLDIDGDAATEMASALGSDHLGMAVDISQEDTAAVAIDKVAGTFGRVDILINNAGGGNRKTSKAYGPPFTRVEQEGWDEQMAINLRTTFAATKAAMPHLKQQDQGSIVNISSVSGLVPDPSMPAYAAAKAAVISLTKSLAVELGRDDIRVNVICPGLLYTRAWKVLSTNMQKQSERYKDMTPYEVFLQVVRRGTPLGREQTPEDVGKLTSFLCSDDARNITGQVIALDGGSSL